MKKDKPWKRLPMVSVIHENLDGFYKFVYERHMIWHRRFVLKEEPPWTKDLFLRDYKFTNVYRELDRGTLWYMKNIVNFGKDYATLFWHTVIYRLLNRVETFEAIGGLPDIGEYSERVFRSQLKKVKKEQGRVFTSAHLTLPTHKRGKSKIETYLESIGYFRKHFDSIYFDLVAADSLENAWKVVKRIPCCGNFIAYEVVCDLMYCKVVPFSEDDWANAGPGCQFGIRLIFPLMWKEKKFLDAMKHLQKMQDYHFGRLNLKMLYFQGKRLSLRNIEHSLCEFGKYWKLTRHCGKNRQRFKPTSTDPGLLPNGQLPLKF